METALNTMPKITRKGKKRIGRGIGSGRGSKSGRGITRHQKGRESIPLAFEGGQGRMIKRFPLLRGRAKNRPSSIRPLIVDLDFLNEFKDGSTVDVETLLKKNLVSDEAKKKGIKVLADGKLDKKLTVKLSVSKGAREAIVKAGGTVSS